MVLPVDESRMRATMERGLLPELRGGDNKHIRHICVFVGVFAFYYFLWVEWCVRRLIGRLVAMIEMLRAF
jgi:hypothetical protein